MGFAGGLQRGRARWSTSLQNQTGPVKAQAAQGRNARTAKEGHKRGKSVPVRLRTTATAFAGAAASRLSRAERHSTDR